MAHVSNVVRSLAAIGAVAILAAGCQSGSGTLRAGIPPKSNVVQEGAGQLIYTADQPGRIYVYDVDRDEVVERYQVRRNQRFALDAAVGRATLDSNEVSIGKLRGGAKYKLYFLPD